MDKAQKNPIIFRSDIKVDLIGEYGGDWLIVDAARVSTRGTIGAGPRPVVKADEIGLINSLVKLRHGGPFGHGGITMYVEAPIFVFREWRTHRVAMVQSTDDFSYSETSARYRPLKPEFWVPAEWRPLIKASDHKGMRPSYLLADLAQYDQLIRIMERTYAEQWRAYQAMLGMDVAPEVARAILGTGIYSAMYVSCNPRSLMHFLSLRTHDPKALFESFPQLEIEEAAVLAESLLDKGWPVTAKAFRDSGRFGP